MLTILKVLIFSYLSLFYVHLIEQSTENINLLPLNQDEKDTDFLLPYIFVALTSLQPATGDRAWKSLQSPYT